MSARFTFSHSILTPFSDEFCLRSLSSFSSSSRTHAFSCSSSESLSRSPGGLTGSRLALIRSHAYLGTNPCSQGNAVHAMVLSESLFNLWSRGRLESNPEDAWVSRRWPPRGKLCLVFRVKVDGHQTAKPAHSTMAFFTYLWEKLWWDFILWTLWLLCLIMFTIYMVRRRLEILFADHLQ